MADAISGKFTYLSSLHNEAKKEKQMEEITVKPSLKRYLILFLFVILTGVKSFQWICFASITNVIAKYYHVSNLDVNWTTVIFMITFLVLAFPVNILMEQIGLRRSIVVGSLGTSLGLIIKCFSIHPDRFYLAIIGHVIIGCVEPFFFSSYSLLAVTWFPDEQVARATAIGVMGDTFGIALGFIVPTLAVGNDLDDLERIQSGLFYLFAFLAVLSTVNSLLILIFFDEQPKYAPGIARFKQITAMKSKVDPQENGNISFLSKLNDYKLLLKEFFSSRDFNLLQISFGINAGTGYAIHTVLNQIIAGDPTLHYPEPILVVGNAGLILLVAGVFGSFACGALLDRIHAYRWTHTLTYLLAVVSVFVLAISLNRNSPLILYLIMIPLGFLLTGYECCGFEYAVELTYPKSEVTSATLLNLSAQVFGIIITFVGSKIVDRYGGVVGCGFLGIAMALGLVTAIAIRPDYRRQQAIAREDEKFSSDIGLTDCQPRR